MSIDLKPKHEAVIRKAAAAVRDRGHEGDARLADSLLGILSARASQPVAAIPEAGQSVPTCAWTLDERDESSVWDSACGEKWIFNDGGPKENDVRYCHGCGKPVLASMSADAQSKGADHAS